jgi:hypothetical protein
MARSIAPGRGVAGALIASILPRRPEHQGEEDDRADEGHHSADHEHGVDDRVLPQKRINPQILGISASSIVTL